MSMEINQDYGYELPQKRLKNKEVLKWGIAIILFVGAPIYLGVRPDDFTPIIQVFFSLFLFLLAFWLGNAKELEKAAKQANQKWVPQAESVIYRLITLQSIVQRFALNSKESCGKTKCELPELETESLKAIRVKIQADCEATYHRLDDIASQLEDAIGDWQRFVAENCDGDECQRIFEAISRRRESIENEIRESRIRQKQSNEINPRPSIN